MDYYKEIKEKLPEDQVYEVIKDYSKNKHRKANKTILFIKVKISDNVG